MNESLENQIKGSFIHSFIQIIKMFSIPHSLEDEQVLLMTLAVAETFFPPLQSPENKQILLGRWLLLLHFSLCCRVQKMNRSSWWCWLCLKHFPAMAQSTEVINRSSWWCWLWSTHFPLCCRVQKINGTSWCCSCCCCIFPSVAESIRWTLNRSSWWCSCCCCIFPSVAESRRWAGPPGDVSFGWYIFSSVAESRRWAGPPGDVRGGSSICHELRVCKSCPVWFPQWKFQTGNW